ncbi:MAG: GntR family transcriptional regulator [Pseudomonadota bacterium]
MLFGKRVDEDDTVVAMLASALRRDIAFGVLVPDQKLKIEALRQRYGGSNHSMRETLRLLSAEGLVEATNQRGFRVMSATEEDLRDILFMRLEVERLGLSRSLERATVTWESEVVGAFHGMARAEMRVQTEPGDLTALEWDESCRAASAALVMASGSPRLIDLQQKLYNQSRRFRLALLREGRIDFAAREARTSALQNAIMARDEAKALVLLEQDIKAELTTEKTA